MLPSALTSAGSLLLAHNAKHSLCQHTFVYTFVMQSGAGESSVPKPKKPRVTSSWNLAPADPSIEQRTFRRSTQEVSAEHKKRVKEAARRQRYHASKTRQRPQRKMTQQEMLEEAKWTELENKASLEAFTRLEEEKKQVKEKKKSIQGPVIRFHSVSMPMISELEPSQDPDPSSRITTTTTPPVPEINTNQQDTRQAHYCRNFLVFTDTAAYPSAYFPTAKPPKPKRLVCPVTGLPAKYIDPITATPYSTPQAFKIIRTRYVRSAEEKCEKRLLQLSNWLEEKKRKKQESRI